MLVVVSYRSLVEEVVQSTQILTVRTLLDLLLDWIEGAEERNRG